MQERQLRSVTAAAPTGAGGSEDYGATFKIRFADPRRPHRPLSQQNWHERDFGGCLLSGRVREPRNYPRRLSRGIPEAA